jgi:hypothetical protein
VPDCPALSFSGDAPLAAPAVLSFSDDAEVAAAASEPDVAPGSPCCGGYFTRITMSINSKIKKFAKNATLFNKLGFTDYDPENLTRGQKSHLTKLAKKHSHYITHPENFAVKKVGKENQKALKLSGFSVSPTGRAIIPLKGADKVTVKKSKLIFHGKKKDEVVYLGGDLKSLVKKARDLSEGLERNQLITFKVGDNAVASVRYLNLADMQHYVNNVLLPRMSQKSGLEPDLFWPQISIVTIKGELKLGSNFQKPKRRRK